MEKSEDMNEQEALEGNMGYPPIQESIPDERRMVEFEGLVTNCFHKKFNNQNQISTLEKLRDTLLPKLMSGEIQVGM